MTPPDRCIVYSANGASYVEEAIRSGLITKSNCGDIPVVLHSDRDIADRPHVFDAVYVRDSSEEERERKFLFKIRSIASAVGDRVLFLDTDAAIVDPRGAAVFDVLDRFELAAAHAVRRTVGPRIENIPECFPEFNSGVMAYRTSTRVNQVWALWEHTYRHGLIPHPHDQGSLRAALYESDLRLATLPPEYNHRFPDGDACHIWHSREMFKRILFPGYPP